MIRQMTRGLAAPIARILTRVAEAVRSAYSFDGVDDRGQLQFKAINPDGDIDIEWRSGPTVSFATSRTIVSQTLTTTPASQEFFLFVSTGAGIVVRVGGAVLSISGVNYSANTKYRFRLQGTSAQLWINDTLFNSQSFTRGAARESTATTQIGSAVNTFFYLGELYDVRINGTLYPMADRNQAIQLPQPSGLGPELVTEAKHTNPAVRGSHWTYLGDGRWQFVGDGTTNELRLLLLAEIPVAGYLEFEVESYSGGGQMRCFSSPIGSGDRLFNSVGVKRWFYNGGTDRWSFDRNSGVVSCVIKNISFKPLWVANATELVTNGNFSNGTTGWSVNGSLAVNSGQGVLTTTAGQNSRFEQALSVEAGAYYDISCDIVALTGVSHAVLNFRRGASSGFTTISEVSRTTAGRISFVAMATGTDAMVQVRGDSTNAGTVTVDNISVRKLDSLCNPLVLANTNPDRWQEVQP